MNSSYIPQRQDIIWINFDPSAGKDIQKRRPALVVSNENYSRRTGFVAVCPITHGQAKLREKGLLVPVHSKKVDGAVNPFQLHTFDFKAKHIEKIAELDDQEFAIVKQLITFIF